MALKLSKKFEPLFRWLSCLPEDPLFKVNKVVITGGRFSQKSFAVGTFACVAAKDYHHRALYTRYTLTAAEDSIVPEFSEKVEMLNAYDAFNINKDRIEGTRNNSKILFKGIKTSSGNQTANLKSLKNFSMFILEEAEEMPSFEDWNKIYLSIRANDVRNLSILLLNPATKEQWIYKEFFEENGVTEAFNGIINNILFIHAEYLDMERELIPDNIWEDFEEKRIAYEIYESTLATERENLPPKTIKAAIYYKHVIKGGWLDKAEGVIITDWIWGEFQEIGTPVYGQDFGFSIDPTTLVQTSIDRNAKKIYVKEHLYKPHMKTTDIATHNLRVAGQHLIYADSAEPRLITEVRDYGCNIKETIKGPGSIIAGIAILQDYTLVVDPSSINIGKELNNYVWHDKKSKTPLDLFNHLIDAIRYAVYPQLKAGNTRTRNPV